LSKDSNGPARPRSATRVDVELTYEGWHRAARQLLAAEIPPEAVTWHERRGEQSLLLDLDGDSSATREGDGSAAPARESGAGVSDAGQASLDSGTATGVTPRAPGVTVPRTFVDLARRIADRGSAERSALLYRVLWRLTHGERRLLDGDDDDVRLLHDLARGVPAGEAAPPTRPRAGASRAHVAGGRGAAPAAVPATADLGELAEAVKGCTACDLYKHATQPVFGRGPRDARLVLVGEQPGDQEDRQGLPFVGPAGEVLDRALADAGIDRARIYVTNAVKHFKFVLRGKRRIHEKPGSTEVAACRPWLDAELASIRPDVLLCLGATAATAMFGKEFRLLKQRGQWLRTPGGLRAMATIHPSAVLRGPDEAAQGALYAMLVGDLRAAAAALGRGQPKGTAAS